MSIYYINPNTRWNSYLLSFDNLSFLNNNKENNNNNNKIIKKIKNNVKFAEVFNLFIF